MHTEVLLSVSPDPETHPLYAVTDDFGIGCISIALTFSTFFSSHTFVLKLTLLQLGFTAGTLGGC